MMGAILSEKSLLKNMKLSFPPIAVSGVLGPVFMSRVVAPKGIFPPGQISPSFFMAVAFGVCLLPFPPRKVLCMQRLVGYS